MITLKAKRFITAKCPRCGKSAVYEIFLAASAPGFGGKGCCDIAVKGLNKRDAALSEKINNRQQYSAIRKCVCPFCGCVMPWSGGRRLPEEAAEYRPVYYSADRLKNLAALVSADEELQKSLELTKQINQKKEAKAALISGFGIIALGLLLLVLSFSLLKDGIGTFLFLFIYGIIVVSFGVFFCSLIKKDKKKTDETSSTDSSPSPVPLPEQSDQEPEQSERQSDPPEASPESEE